MKEKFVLMGKFCFIASVIHSDKAQSGCVSTDQSTGDATLFRCFSVCLFHFKPAIKNLRNQDVGVETSTRNFLGVYPAERCQCKICYVPHRVCRFTSAHMVPNDKRLGNIIMSRSYHSSKISPMLF